MRLEGVKSPYLQVASNVHTYVWGARLHTVQQSTKNAVKEANSRLQRSCVPTSKPSIDAVCAQCMLDKAAHRFRVHALLR